MRMTEWEWKAKVSIFSAAMLVGQLCHFGQFCQLWRVEACVAGVIASHVKSLRGCFPPIWLLAILTLGGATLWTTPSLAHFELRALHFHVAKLLHTLLLNIQVDLKNSHQSIMWTTLKFFFALVTLIFHPFLLFFPCYLFLSFRLFISFCSFCLFIILSFYLRWS